MRPESRFPGWGDTLIGWACEAYTVAHFVGYTLPLCAWKYWTGQIPPPPARPRHLPVRLRERTWCTVCERVLAADTVRCPEHPQGEVMLVLRDEEPR